MIRSKRKEIQANETKHTLTSEEQPSDCDVKIMTLSIMLNAAGLLPPAKSSSLIRLAYKVFVVFIHILFVLTLIGQVMAVVVYWGDIPLIATTISLMTSLIGSMSSSINFLLNRKKYMRLADTLKTEFVAKLKSKYIKIILNAERQVVFCGILVCIVAVCIGFIWIVVPFLSTNTPFDFANEKSVKEGSRMEELILVMWLPSKFEQSPQFEIIVFLQIFVVTFALAMIYSVDMMLLSLMSHAAAQFRVLNAMLNDMHENVREDEIHRTRNMAPLVTGTDISYMEFSSANSWNGNTEHSGSAGVELESLKNEDCEEDPVRQYLVECIRYHQAVIE
jgi:hypothetical protein